MPEGSYVKTSPFGMREDPLQPGLFRMHYGTDFAAAGPSCRTSGQGSAALSLGAHAEEAVRAGVAQLIIERD